MKKVLVYGLKNMWGGLERYLLNMQAQICDDVRLVYMTEQCDCIHQDHIHRYGGEILYLPPKHPLKPHLQEICRVLKEQRQYTDTLYMNINSITFDIAVVLLGAHYGYRLVIHSHNAGMEHIASPAHRMLHKVLEFGDLQLMKCVKATRLAVSDRAADYLFPGCSYEIVVPGTDVKNFAFDPVSRQQTRQKLGLDDAYVYGFVGRLVDVKNPSFLLQVFDQICRIRQENCRLLMVGGGPMREVLEAQAQQMGLADRVIFIGDTNAPAQYYQAMDYLLMPSLSEGAPMVTIEAQAAGIPMTCSEKRIPKSIALTPLVNYAPLEDGARAWAESCIAHGRQFDEKNRGEWNAVLYDSIFETQKAARRLKEVLLDA